MIGIIFDLDQTLIDSRAAEPFRRASNWQQVYRLIPQLRPYPGIPELLAELNCRDIPICIVTSAPASYCSRVIRYWQWNIGSTVCYHDTKLHKPHPEPILKGAQCLGVDPSKVISVGDDPKDILAARAAKGKSVAALWGSANKLELTKLNPDYQCQSVKELHELLASFIQPSLILGG